MENALMLRSVATNRESERDLLKACRRRDVGAFETLYKLHGTRMKSVAYHVVGNRQDAEDAVQEAFVKAYRGMDDFRGDSSIATWLCRIVVNVCYDQLRKRQPQVELGAQPERSVPSASMRVALEDALRRI